MNGSPYKLFLLALCLVSMLSCSEESDATVTEIESQDLLVGEWIFISEHSYYCENDEIATERYAEGVVNTFTFHQDGTYIENENGGFSNKGEWTKNENNTYTIVEKENQYSDADALGTYDIKVAFDGNDVLKWDIYGCQDNSSDTYVYALYNRNN